MYIWKDKEKTKLAYKPDWVPKVVLGQELGDPDCPYLKRWVINSGKFGAVRLHHWMGSDDPRYMHDHGWGFWTLVLKGGYDDVTECHECKGVGVYPAGSPFITLPYCFTCLGSGKLRERLTAPSLKYRPALHKHTVQTHEGGAWTLLITGPFVRKWGFYVDGKFMGVRKYFRKFGHHPCED